MKRIIYLDLLKILACISVITIHVSMQNINNVLVNSSQYIVFNFYTCMVRYAVPIFIMVSGVNLLDNKKELSMKKLFTKYFSKILVCYLFWATIYALFFKNFSLNGIVRGNYHLWYLLMLLGLYLITPLLREITKSIKLSRYFIILGIIFAFLIPNIFTIMKLYPPLDDTEKLLFMLNKRISFSITVCFPVYYMLGYYLHSINISKIKEYLSYILGIIGYCITFILSYLTTTKSLNIVETFYELSSLAILCQSIAVFILFKKHCDFNLSDNKKQVIKTFTSCGLGIYLIHPLLLDKSPLTTLAFNPIISVPIIVAIVFLVSLVISFILNKIPIIKKWIV